MFLTLNAFGEVKCRRVNGQWFFGLHPDFKAVLDEREQREIEALTASGLPAVVRG